VVIPGTPMGALGRVPPPKTEAAEVTAAAGSWARSWFLQVGLRAIRRVVLPARARGVWIRVPTALWWDSKADEVIAGAMASAEFLSKSIGSGRRHELACRDTVCVISIARRFCALWDALRWRQTDNNGGLILAGELLPQTRPPQHCARQIVRTDS